MSKGYWIARVNVRDSEAFKKYASKAKLAIEKYGGKYVARGGKFSVLEGKHDFERNVVVEFDSVETLKVRNNAKNKNLNLFILTFNIINNYKSYYCKY